MQELVKEKSPNIKQNFAKKYHEFNKKKEEWGNEVFFNLNLVY